MRATARGVVWCVGSGGGAERGPGCPALRGEDAVAVGGAVAGPGDVVGVVGDSAASVVGLLVVVLWGFRRGAGKGHFLGAERPISETAESLLLLYRNTSSMQHGWLPRALLRS